MPRRGSILVGPMEAGLRRLNAVAPAVQARETGGTDDGGERGKIDITNRNSSTKKKKKSKREKNGEKCRIPRDEGEADLVSTGEIIITKLKTTAIPTRKATEKEIIETNLTKILMPKMPEITSLQTEKKTK